MKLVQPAGLRPGPSSLYLLLLLLSAPAAAPNAALPVIPANTFYITNYGAGTNLAAVQSAINAASAAGGGTVRVTPGNFLSSPLTFTSNLNLQLDAGATLTALPFSQYPGGDISPPDFITGSGLHDVEISGTGAIDGQGLPWWNDDATNGAAVRPRMISFSGCSPVLIQDVTLTNSPKQFLIVKGMCGNVTIQRVQIYADSSSPNTDGIDLEATNVLIRDCLISNGDDSVAVSGGTSHAPSSGILITNCAFSNGHGVSVGSHTDGGVSNLTVVNCTFNGTINGIRLKSDRGDGGLVQDLHYLNLGMTNVEYPILIYSYYQVLNPNSATPSLVAADPVQTMTGMTPLWRDITISNVTATTSGTYPPITIWGLPEALVSNVTLSRVNISGASGAQNGKIYNANGILFIDSQITLPSGVKTFQLYNAQLTITNSAPISPSITFDGLTTNGVGNALALYNTQASLSNTNAIDDGPITLEGATLTINNNFTLFPSTVLNYALGTNATQIAVVGNLTLGGTINVTNGPGFGPGINTVLTCSGVRSGNLPALGAVVPGYTYAFDTNTAGQVKLVVQGGTNTGWINITQQPVGTNAVAPHTATFSVTANAVGTSDMLHFQWRSNAADIAGATASSYTTPPLSASANGALYDCKLMAGPLTVFSAGALLNVITPALPPVPVLWLPFNGSLADLGTSTNVHAVFGQSAFAYDLGCGHFLVPRNGYNGRFTNDVASGNCGADSLSLAGDESFVIVTNVSDLNFNTNHPFTISAWMNLLEGTIAAKATTNFNPKGTKARNLTLYVGNPTGTKSGVLVLDGFYNKEVDSTIPVTNGWTQVAAVYDGTNAGLYINGWLNNRGLFTGCNEGANGEGPWSFTVGGSLNTLSLYECSGTTFPSVADGEFLYSDSLNGEIDEVAVWNSALTPGQIYSVFRHGVQVPLPALIISQSGSQVTLSWAGTGYILQQNSALTNSTGWADVAGGGASPVTITRSSGDSFYRLVSQ